MKAHKKVMEFFWLFTAVVGAVFSWWVLSHGHWPHNWSVLLVPVIAFLLFLLRRIHRKNTEIPEKGNN